MTLTVVVVDDDPETLDFLELFLSIHGVHVVASDYTGDVGLLIQQTCPDVVLLDLQNGLDHTAGLSVLDQLRADAETASIPVFLMSADHFSLDGNAARIQELGATLFRKPFDGDRLIRMIQQAAA